MENLNNTDKTSENAEKELCRCSSISEISKKRVKELIGLKKYARDQFTVGLIDSQIKYWSDVSESYSIKIDSVSNFRYELIKMIEQVRYNIGEYKDISSSQVAEKFEQKINSH